MHFSLFYCRACRNKKTLPHFFIKNIISQFSLRVNTCHDNNFRFLKIYLSFARVDMFIYKYFLFEAHLYNSIQVIRQITQGRRGRAFCAAPPAFLNKKPVFFKFQRMKFVLSLGTVTGFSSSPPFAEASSFNSHAMLEPIPRITEMPSLSCITSSGVLP